MNAVERRIGTQGLGVLLGLSAVTLWGSQFPVAKSLFASIDPYTLSSLRYLVATLLYLVLLACLEGRASVRYDGRFRSAAALGSIGFTGAVLLPYVGLQHTNAQSASLLTATQPLLVAVILRARGGPRLSRTTLATLALAFAGVGLVITRGHPSALVHGSLGWGLALILIGQLGWVVYTIEGTSLGWSPLRFTALTALPGTAAVVILTGFATAAGFAHPSGASVTAAPWLLTFSILGPAFFAVFAWNLTRLLLGAQHTALFMNLVPITTFTIEAIRGYRPNGFEYAGAIVTIGALAVYDLTQRRRAVLKSAPARGEAVPAEASA